MGDYISREAVRDVLAKYYPGAGPNAERMIHKINADVKAIPAADVVEVVRCVDCYQWEAYDGYNGDRGLGWCDEGHGDTTHAMFFCGCGKRKDGADNG